LKKIASISPYFFEGYFIIALHQNLIQKFGKIPTFDVFIDSDSRLVIRSKNFLENTNGE